MIRLIVLDLDGTLLVNGELKEKDILYLEWIQSKGIKIMLATGRNQADAEAFVDKLSLRKYKGAIVCSDGQYLLDFSDGTKSESVFLNYEKDLKDIFARVPSREGSIQVFCKNKNYKLFGSTLSFAYIKTFIKSFLCGKKDILILKYNYSIDDIEKATFVLQKQSEEIKQIAGDYELVYVHDKRRFEIKKKGVNKAQAIETFRIKYGYLKEELVVFGNDENDTCMFECFSNSYVSSDAPQHVKEKANDVFIVGHVVETIERVLEEGFVNE